MIDGWNDPIRSVANTTPERAAVIDTIDDRTVSYEELDGTVDRAVAHLVDRGVAPGYPVAIALGQGLSFVVALHAVRRADGIAVPIDPSLAIPRRAERLDQIRPCLMIGAENAGGDTHSQYEYISDQELRDDPPDVSQPGEIRGIDYPTCLLYTSGTTGTPRAVGLSTKNFIASAAASALRLGVLPDDRWLSPLAPHHMGGIAPIIRCAYYGTTYVTTTTDVDRIRTVMQDRQLSGISVVPVLLDRLLDVEAPLADLRFVLTGGDAVPPALVERCLDRDVPIYVSYGMTETTSQIATATPAELAEEPTTVGHPLRGVTVTIDNADTTVPGESGEIVVSGPTVSDGYWQDEKSESPPNETAEIRTGDCGRLSQGGHLFITGRIDERIVSGGVTIDPRRIERELEDHPRITGAAVVGIPDPEWGERVCALLEATAEVDPDELIGQLTAAERPKEIRFGELPRTASGTVARSRVREWSQDSRSDGSP